MKLQPELLSKPKAAGFIQSFADLEDLTIDFDTLFVSGASQNIQISEYNSLESIKIRYSIIQALDANIENDIILNVDAANRIRKIKLSGLINFMVKTQTVDFNILKKENITETDLLKLYYYHKHSSEFISKVVREHPFIETELNRLAALGEPYATMNAKEIEVYENKIRMNPADSWKPKPRSLLIQSYRNKIKQLSENDEYLFPIENLCCMVRQSNKFKDYDFRRLSPTSQDSLITLFIQLYKAEYSKEIAAYRDKKNRTNKNLKRNTKKTTATDKRDLIKDELSKGLDSKQIACNLGFNIRTVQRYLKDLQ